MKTQKYSSPFFTLSSSLFTLFFTLFTFLSLAQMPTEHFERLSTKDGLSQSFVTCIFHDTRGFMWFGTSDGLNRYDGYTFKVYKPDSKRNSISGNYIQCIYEDKNANLWIGTRDKGLNCYNRKTERFEWFNYNSVSAASLPDSSVTSVFGDKSGQLWIGTANGLCKYVAATNSFERVSLLEKNEAGMNTINCIAEDNDNNLWIGTEAGLIKLAANRKDAKLYQSKANNKSSISHNQIHTVFVEKDGSVYIGTNKGFDMYNSYLDDFIRFNLSNKMLQSEVYAITSDPRGNIWIGTFGNGLIKFNKQNESIIDYHNSPENLQSLSGDYIYSLAVDRSGLLWIGIYGDENTGGINKLDMTRIKFEKFTKKEKEKNTLISGDANAIILDSENQVWIGTDKGISIYKKSTDHFINLQNVAGNPRSLSENSVYCMLQDSKNNVWIGTSSTGLNKLSAENLKNDKFEFEHLNADSNSPKSLQSNNILCLYESKNNNIWIGTDNGITVINEAGDIISSIYNKDGGEGALSDNQIQCIFEDKSGSFWFGTTKSVTKYNPKEKRFARIKCKSSKDNDATATNVYCIAQDNEGFIWIGTENNGLFRYEAEKNIFLNYTTKNGLPDNLIFGILIDNESSIWVSTNKGLCKITKNRLGDYTFTNYSNGSGLQFKNFNIGAYYKDQNNILYFGGNDGVVYFNPSEIKGNQFVPPVTITKFLLNFKEVEITANGEHGLKEGIGESKEITVPAHKRLTFEFAALNFIQSSKNEYAYKMEGVDDDWIYIKNQRTAEYSGLSTGTYVFRVKASNNNGVWNEEGIAIKVRVPPPFYLTWWFVTLATLVILYCIYRWNRFRISRIEAQKEELEKLVKERTIEITEQKHELQEKAELLKQANEELNTTNEELNATLENLKTTQSQLIDSEKMASLGQLTAGVAHEINNPINFISGNIPPLKRDIDDLTSILNLYDELVQKNKLQTTFNEVEELKEELDYQYVIDEIDKLLNGISEGTSRTTAIVKGLRNFSRLDEDDMKLANINEGLESTILILRNKLKNKAEVVTNYGEIPEIICFPGKMNQVFMNIINNAADAIEDNGIIKVTTTGDAQNVYISIKDNGSGIPESIKKRIFDPFFTTKDVGDGTGLGLSISYGIIEKHKGKIDVNSVVGKGTEFIITLPIVQQNMGN